MLETILEIPIKSPPPHLAKTTSATPIVIPVKYWNPPAAGAPAASACASAAFAGATAALTSQATRLQPPPPA